MGAQAFLDHVLLKPVVQTPGLSSLAGFRKMPLGGKALKKREQASNAKAGIVTDDAILRKQATAKEDVKCTVCMQAFKVTKKNADQKAHAESKHPKCSFAECFPGLECA